MLGWLGQFVLTGPYLFVQFRAQNISVSVAKKRCFLHSFLACMITTDFEKIITAKWSLTEVDAM